MPTVEANGITIEYERTGAGEPVLLVMGLGGQLTSWPQAFVDEIASRGYEVIRFDNRDAGLSTEFAWEPPPMIKAFLRKLFRRPADVGYTVPDMADDAAGLLDALDIPRAHVVGMSMGGMISQALAIRHPQKVASLCSVMSNPGDRSGGPKFRVMARFARAEAATTKAQAIEGSVETFRMISGPHFDEHEARKMAEVDVERSFRPEGTARQMAAIFASPDRRPGLAGVTAPTLVVHGMVDPLVQPSGGRSTAMAIPGSRLLEFNDMGHDLPRPRIPEIVDAIVTNIERART